MRDIDIINNNKCYCGQERQPHNLFCYLHTNDLFNRDDINVLVNRRPGPFDAEKVSVTVIHRPTSIEVTECVYGHNANIKILEKLAIDQLQKEVKKHLTNRG